MCSGPRARVLTSFLRPRSRTSFKPTYTYVRGTLSPNARRSHARHDYGMCAVIALCISHNHDHSVHVHRQTTHTRTYLIQQTTARALPCHRPSTQRI